MSKNEAVSPRRKAHASVTNLRLTLGVLLLALLALALIPATAAAQQTLNALKDKHRVLLVFAPGETDPRYVQQLRLFEHHGAEMRERDLLVIPVLTESGPQITPETLRVMRGPDLPEGEQLLARHRFHIAPESFAIFLLGKDGGEKLRSATPLTVDRLSRTIDAMPMRQTEIRDRNPR